MWAIQAIVSTLVFPLIEIGAMLHLKIGLKWSDLRFIRITLTAVLKPGCRQLFGSSGSVKNVGNELEQNVQILDVFWK